MGIAAPTLLPGIPSDEAVEPAPQVRRGHRRVADALSWLVGEVVSDRVTLERDVAEGLVGVLGATLRLSEEHAVDRRGRCMSCGWWRRRRCEVHSTLAGFLVPRSQGRSLGDDGDHSIPAFGSPLRSGRRGSSRPAARLS